MIIKVRNSNLGILVNFDKDSKFSIYPEHNDVTHSSFKIVIDIIRPGECYHIAVSKSMNKKACIMATNRLIDSVIGAGPNAIIDVTKIEGSFEEYKEKE